MVEINSRRTAERAALHRALGEEHRLELVDCLLDSDRTPGELAALTGLPSNLLAFHLRGLEDAGIVERHRSEGDARRRYVRLRTEALEMAWPTRPMTPPERVLFVCTHNSARSQFAEALWGRVGGSATWSAGTTPAERVHPRAVAAARMYGVDLSGVRPKGYDEVPDSVDLLVSVCDRAFESEVAVAGPRMHWSVPDPIRGGDRAFEAAFREIAHRVDRLRSRTR